MKGPEHLVAPISLRAISNISAITPGFVK